MSKQLHKIYFWLVLVAFVMSLSLLYILNEDTILGVVYPNNVKVQGDTLFGTDIMVDNQSFTSGTFNWSKLSEQVKDKINSLIGDDPCVKTNIICSTNIDEIIENINPDGKPEGQMWYYTGSADAVVSDAIISGKGTIIIKGKNLKIAGSIKYSEDVVGSIGFIVLEDNGIGGSIEIEQEVSELVGAYYAQKEIIFKYVE